MSRKVYSYGGKKRTNASDSWNKALENSPKKKKLPLKKGIWSAVSVSPFKLSNNQVKEETTGSDDIFGFQDDMGIGEQAELESPLKKTSSKQKMSMNSPSPQKRSRVHGKLMPRESVSLTLDDLKCFGSPKKKSVKSLKDDTQKTKINIFRQGKTRTGKINKRTVKKLVDVDGNEENSETQDSLTTLQSVTDQGNQNVSTNSTKVRKTKQTDKLSSSAPSNSQESTNTEKHKPTKIKTKVKTANLFGYYDKQNKSTSDNKANIYAGTNKVNSENDSASKSVGAVKRDLFDHDRMSTNSEDDVIPSQTSTLDSQSSTEIDSSQGSSKVKSPFKSLKARSNRRFSALPTSISSLDFSGEEEQHDNSDQEDDVLTKNFDDDPAPPPLYTSTLFGFSHRVDSAMKVKRSEKELFTVVKNTKHAHECLEYGESQQFKDDLEYLLGGLKSSHNISTRSLSALELASRCTSPSFRMHMKAHDIIITVFNSLQDALTDERLALATTTLMFILAKDKLKISFNRQIIEFMLKFLRKTSDTSLTSSREYTRLVKKVKVILEKQDVSYIDENEISSVVLARETLLSFTSQRIGEWFKDEIRTLGGLDHLIDTVYTCCKCIQNRQHINKNSHTMERCMLLLSDMAFRSSKNQQYLDSYSNSLLIDSCIRTLTYITTKVNLTKDFTLELRDCLFSLLRLLTNLSHENASGCTNICKQRGALTTILRCGLDVPQFLPTEKTFDCIVMSIGLLINIVEHSKANIGILKTASAPSYYESSQSSEESSPRKGRSKKSGRKIDELHPVDALMQLFLTRYEACKEGDLMEELDKLEKEEEERDARMHFHDDDDALTCGDKFDDTVEEGANINTSVVENKMATTVVDQNELNQKEQQDIRNTLKKAHQHMEDSHVAAYAALLIGLLIEDDELNQERVVSLLHDRDFRPMKDTLEKIFAFMKMTGATNEAGLTVIARIIKMYEVLLGSDTV